jgi:uncharacterized protein YidB (DUF937 family)
VLAAWLKPRPSETETQSEISEVRGLACRVKKLIKNHPSPYSAARKSASQLKRGNKMGILDTIQALAGQAGQSAGTDQAKVAGGFIEALTQHPEGIQGVLDAFKNNGMAEHVGAWSTGQNATATPEQVQQGLGSTGLIETTAAKAGVSPQIVQMALATVLPMVIQHFAPNGQATPQSSMGSMAQQLLGKFL